jgi:hypothetical protein
MIYLPDTNAFSAYLSGKIPEPHRAHRIGPGNLQPADPLRRGTAPQPSPIPGRRSLRAARKTSQPLR